jgi:hypothetical protein
MLWLAQAAVQLPQGEEVLPLAVARIQRAAQAPVAAYVHVRDEQERGRHSSSRLARQEKFAWGPLQTPLGNRNDQTKCAANFQALTRVGGYALSA